MLKFVPILLLTIMLYACPYESKVALENGPVEPIDSSLIGYWYGIIKDGSDFFGIEALEITRQSDSVYAIIRYGKSVKADMVVPDTAYFTGYTSSIGDQKFMNVEGSLVLITKERKKKEPVVTTQKVFYVSAITRRHDTLQVRTITDNFSPVARKGFGAPEEFKTEIISLLGQQKNIYDDTYSLSYRKIEKPQPIKPF